MNKIILSALAATSAVAAIAAAAPASAQSGGYGGYGGNAYGNSNLEVRADQLQMRLQAGIRSGAITRAEAMPLREQLRQLTRLEMLYARDGISSRERIDLQQRISSLRQGIRMAERSGDGRYGQDDRDGRWQDRDGRWHDGDDRYGDARPCPPGLAKKNNGCLPPGQVGRDDRDGRWDDDRDDDRYGRGDVDSRYDRNNDGWDDRDGNRDGRWDVDSRYDSNRDGYDDRDYNRDGRWDNDQGYRQTNNGGIVGQILDRVTGNGGLRVGQRVSSNLGGVPYAYRNQYRDGDGVYYRSDSRNIYQIDARTQTVVRVYAMNR